MAPIRCSLCNAPHATCGEQRVIAPIEIHEAKGRIMSDLKEYTDATGATYLLTEQDAKTRGLLGSPVVPTDLPVSSKVRTVANK